MAHIDRAGRPSGRQLGHTLLAPRLASLVHRAQLAAWTGAQTDSGAEVHQPLGVGLNGTSVGRIVGLTITRLVLINRRQQAAGQIPQALLDRPLAGKALDAEDAAQHAFDIAIEDRFASAPGKGCNRCRSRAADTRQGLERRRIVRKHATVARHHQSGAGMQIARAAVVAKAAPEGKHLVRFGGCQRRHIRKPFDEARVVAEHGLHLGLLQHDLGDPDAIRIASLLPGQGMPAAAALPGDQPVRKRLV